ncbi:MAG TPA: hypothetical protein VNN79_11500, partial [Actinomycetota bacterium]|nr:hypothetical protein [Actinomycetota bacterium]
MIAGGQAVGEGSGTGPVVPVTAGADEVAGAESSVAGTDAGADDPGPEVEAAGSDPAVDGVAGSPVWSGA